MILAIEMKVILASLLSCRIKRRGNKKDVRTQSLPLFGQKIIMAGKESKNKLLVLVPVFLLSPYALYNKLYILMHGRFTKPVKMIFDGNHLQRILAVHFLIFSVLSQKLFQIR